MAEVGADSLIVHREDDPDPTVAYALSRLASSTTEPTHIGVFRDLERPEYGAAVNAQLAAAQAEQGPGDLDALLSSLPTWNVG